MKIIHSLVNAVKDLFVLLLPETKKSDDYKFAFLVHPRSRLDIERKFHFFKHLPHFCVDIFTKYCWPITLSEIEGVSSKVDGKQIKGYVISVLPTAHQMFENRKLALKRIIQACRLAKKKGVTIIGLGGLTSSFSKGGLDLVNVVDLNITTGHAYTSYNIRQNVCSLVDYMELNKQKIFVGIVGAAGSVGSTTAKLLVRDGFLNFILVDVERKKDYFISLVSELLILNKSVNVLISHQIGDIKKCDIIVAATNAPEALIKSSDLKYGAIVIDDAQPSDVHPEVLKRKDILVIEAGVTYTPNIFSNFNFGLKNKNDNFCCLAEVFILAANNWNEHYVINRASLELVDNIAELGDKLYFKIGEYQNFNELITNDRLLFVKNCIKNGLSN